MSDSDLSDNVFTFQNEGSIVSANGPNIKLNNLKGLSFRNNDLTSTTINKTSMSRNLEWQRRPGGVDHPGGWSTASACDARQRNYHDLFYPRAMNSQRLNIERARSPTMSLRSIDSNASAVDIITLIKHFRGSEKDKKRIHDASKNILKNNTMKRIVKRKHRRAFVKYRRESGNDSGELGSNSSLSSDDDRSTRTFNYKNMSSCRSTKTDIADIRRNIIDTNMVKDCTNSFRQNMHNGAKKLNSIRSSVSLSRSIIDRPTISKSFQPPINNINIIHSQSSMNESKCYRDRIKSRLILPSQRFNQSIAATLIPEISSRHPVSQEGISDEEIFSNPTSSERPTSNLRKRGINTTDDIMSLPNNKKFKVAQKDFEFVKPACPVPKTANVKSNGITIPTSTNINGTEQLISKSASLPPIQNNSEPVYENEDDIELQTTSQNNKDVSMRPSFMKRKLFSQTMDVTKITNDIANSPQNSVYGKIQKEKNKARKLVTSQYCLSRDIQTDENNILDLIHKIVPAECMNATAQSNKTIIHKKSVDKDNGDVTSIFSARNNNEEDLSDTFTDEETFIACNGELSSSKTGKKVCKSPLKNVQKPPQKPLSKKSPVKKLKKSPCEVSKLSKNILAEKNDTPAVQSKGMEKMQENIKSFWDTDFTDIESDVEFTPASRKESEKASKENQNTDAALSVAYKPAFQDISNMNPVNNATIINNTVDSTLKFSNTNSIFKLSSHRISKPKKIACEKVNESTIQIKPLSTAKKNTKSDTGLEVTVALENYTQPVNEKKVNTKVDKPKPKRIKTPPKTQNKAKAVKYNTTNAAKEKESKLVNDISDNDKTLGEENKKQQKQKTKNIQSKPENNGELNTTQNKKNNKKGATAPQNQTKQTREDKESLNVIKNKQKNNACKSKKPDLNTKEKNKNNNKPCVIKTNTTKLSDSLIYEDSFNETNNNSIRPIRSCRLSKENKGLGTSKVNQTLNVTLRSRIKKPDKEKPATKSSESKEQQANLSDQSFLVAQKKSITIIKSRPKEVKKIDYSDSDISFSLTDKDSHFKNKGFSAKLTNRRVPLNTRNKKECLSKQLTPVRTSARILNRRYFN